MNTEPSDRFSTEAASAKKRSVVSIPILIAVALAAGAYYLGPTAMSYYFLLEGQGKVPRIPYTEVAAPDQAAAPSNIGNVGMDGNRGMGGGEMQSLSSADRAKRRPPAEFDEEPQPVTKESTPEVPKT